MKRTSHEKMALQKGWKFFLYPAAFFLAALMLFMALVWPYASGYVDLFSLMLLQTPPTFDEKAANIFEPGMNAKAEGALMRSEVTFPAEGESFGKIHIDSIGVDAPLIYGDNIKNMKKGVEVYSGTYLPGQSHTVLIGGHNNTYFRTLESVKPGARIELDTNYGSYVYEVVSSRVARFDDTGAYDLTKSEENLILYTCHEVGGVGATPYRVFVYGKYVSGPKIVS